MTTIKIKKTRLFDDTVREYKNKKKIIIHEGGSRSGKTFAIIHFCLWLITQEKNLVFTFCRDKLTWLKVTLLKDFEAIIKKGKIPIKPYINASRPDQIYKIYDAEFAFFGLDDPQKLHGRKQDVFWINESMEATEEDFDQLEMRTSKLGFLDYNPTDDRHWIFENVARRPDVAMIKSTMKDNPFLEKSIIRKINSYKPTEENIKNGTADKYMWEVYGLGRRARLEGVVYERWNIIPVIPEKAKLIGYGLDFGYSNNPTSLVAVHMYEDELYVDEMIYEKGLTNPNIAKKMEELEVNENDEIYADSAEPKSIDEIYDYNFNIKPVVKGQDSINFGIDVVKQRKINITERSVNLEKELRNYKWMEDKKGKRLNKPVDNFNHALDALRYLCVMKISSQKESEISVEFI